MKKFIICFIFSAILADPQHLISQMSLKEKIGQLFIANICIDSTNNYKVRFPERTTPEYVKMLIDQYNIGGIHFTGYSTIEHCKQEIEELQKLSRYPLLVSQDFESGAAMRLLDAPKFPYNLTLGAIQDNNLIYSMGKEIARQCKILGVHLNCAPVVDINTNSDNVIINYRSFGDDKLNVTNKALTLMHGMLDGGILCCAKHFPGHGDTEIDSHIGLPVINYDKKRLKEIELFPFEALINSGIPCIMTGHLQVNILDKNLPATISYKILTELLQNELKFRGLIITDGLNMQALTNFYLPGEVDLKALIAGADLLLLSEDIPTAFRLIENAITKNLISEEEIDRKVKKILKAKEELGILYKYKPALDENFETEEVNKLIDNLYKSAVTTFNFEGTLKEREFIYIQIGNPKETDFIRILKQNNCVFEMVDFAKSNNIINKKIVISLFNMSKLKRDNFGISTETIEKIKLLNNQNDIILIIFGSPYSLNLFKDIQAIIAYEEEPAAQKYAALTLLGKHHAIGKLPIKINYFETATFAGK